MVGGEGSEGAGVVGGEGSEGVSVVVQCSMQGQGTVSEQQAGLP